MQTLNFLKVRLAKLYDFESCSKYDLDSVEELLGINLPEDFRAVAGFYRGGLLGGISHYEIASSTNWANVVDETIRLRSTINLSHDYVVLAEPPGSLIVLNISNAPAVIWCDAVDAENINSQCFSTEPDVWQSYSDFFDFLLNRDESDDG